MDIAKIRVELENKRTELEGTLKAVVGALAALDDSKTVRRSPGRRRLSLAARRRIADAQKARWAEYRKKKRQKGVRR